jgi:hypothetical protein
MGTEGGEGAGAGVPVRSMEGRDGPGAEGGGETDAGVTAGAESLCTGTSARMGSYHPIPKPSACP